MANKTVYDLTYDSSVAASTTDIQLSPIVASGKQVRVKKFGGLDPAIGDNIDSLIALQWGSGGSWAAVVVGSKQFQYEINKVFTGDGSKRFRIVRQNKSIVAKVIYAWVEAMVDDV